MSKDEVKLKRKERESDSKDHKKEKRERKEKKEKKGKKDKKDKKEKKEKNDKANEPIPEIGSETKEPSTPKPVSSGASAVSTREFMESNNITIEMAEESNDKPPRPMLSFDELHDKIDAKLKERLDM